MPGKTSNRKDLDESVLQEEKSADQGSAPTPGDLLDAARRANAAMREKGGQSSSNDVAQTLDMVNKDAAFDRLYKLGEQEKIIIYSEHLGFGQSQAEGLVNPFTSGRVRQKTLSQINEWCTVFNDSTGSAGGVEASNEEQNALFQQHIVHLKSLYDLTPERISEFRGP